MKLFRKQTIALEYLQDNETTEILYGGAAGGGKSALGCYWITKNCFKYPGTRWLIGRAILKTLKETTVKTLFEIFAMQGVTPKMYRYNQQANEIRFINGSEIILKDLYTYSTDPQHEELGSLEITGAFVDEAGQITTTSKNILKSRIRFKLKQYNLIPKILYASNPSKNWMYSDFWIPYRKGQLKDGKVFVQSFVHDNIELSEHYAKNLESLDPMNRERLLKGNWDYDLGGEKIKTEWIRKFSLADLEAMAYDKGIPLIWDYTIDGAYTKDPENDATGLLAFARIFNNMYIREAQNVRLEMPELLKYIPSFVANNGYTKQSRIWIEPKANGLSVAQMLHRETKLNIIIDKPPRTSKEQRVDQCVPFIESKRLHTLEHAAFNEEYIGQLVLFPNAEHDDLVDCTTMGIDRIEINNDVEYFDVVSL